MGNPLLINYQTLQAECHDTEARSLKKINELLLELSGGSVPPGGGSGGTPPPGGLLSARNTDFVYGVSYTLPANKNFYDVSIFNPSATPEFVLLFVTPSPPTNGQTPSFPIFVPAESHAYYETVMMVSAFGPNNIYLVVSDVATSLTASTNKLFIAVNRSA